MVIPFLAFLFGLLIGSFLNVCIHRLPEEESVVHPRSRCPHCGQPIRWYDNIPVLSFVLLAGRCRDCQAALSFLYPVVELATGCLFVLVVARFGLSMAALKAALFVALMLALGATDLLTRLLPDELTLGGAGAGLALSLVHPLQPGLASLLLGVLGWRPSPRLGSAAESLLAATVSAGLLYLIAELYYRIRFREGMGLGDVKMMAMIGAFLGLRQAFLAVILASIAGTVLGLLFILLFRKGLAYELPFGTFLAFSSIVLAVWGSET
ncbi:MAG: prepilin peptidase [Acidobacteria bacterium]|nr:prepilin peptidase [Acidobacteriota bacterium]